jgi:hypothetical protein
MRFTELTNEQRRQLIDGRARLTNNDRWFLIQLHRWFPSILQVVTIIHPETLQHLVRPAMSLAAFELGLIARFTRNAMIDAMNGDYALVAFAKGPQRLRVLWLHAFRGDPVRDVARVRPPRLVCSRPTQ